MLEAIKASKQRVAGTCRWHKQRDEYQDWLLGDEPKRLWISGDPGSGKTTTLTAIIDELQHVSDNEPSVIVLFFFFDSKIERQGSAVSAALSLVGQLLKERPRLFQHVRHLSRNDLNSLPILWGCLAKMIRLLKQKVYILLDAVDEYRVSPESNLFAHLNDEASPLAAKILISCRPEVRKPQCYISLRIRHKDIRDDILKVIDARLKELHDYPLDLRQHIKAILSRGTHRTFSVVVFLIEYMKTEQPDRFLEHQLWKPMSTELRDVHARIISKITSTCDNRLVQFILHCVIVALRPLTVEEVGMSYCSGWETGKQGIVSTGSHLSCQDHMWALCKTLLFHDNKTDTINLVLPTARERLLWTYLVRGHLIYALWQSDLLSPPRPSAFTKLRCMRPRWPLQRHYLLRITIACIKAVFVTLGFIIGVLER